jgi:hypothetical protein
VYDKHVHDRNRDKTQTQTQTRTAESDKPTRADKQGDVKHKDAEKSSSILVKSGGQNASERTTRGEDTKSDKLNAPTENDTHRTNVTPHTPKTVDRHAPEKQEKERLVDSENTHRNSDATSEPAQKSCKKSVERHTAEKQEKERLVDSKNASVNIIDTAKEPAQKSTNSDLKSNKPAACGMPSHKSDTTNEPAHKSSKKSADVPSDPKSGKPAVCSTPSPSSDTTDEAPKKSTKKSADVPSDPKSGKSDACGIPSQHGDTTDEASNKAAKKSSGVVKEQKSSKPAVCSTPSPSSDATDEAPKKSTKKSSDVPSDPKSSKPAVCGILSQHGDTTDEAPKKATKKSSDAPSDPKSGKSAACVTPSPSSDTTDEASKKATKKPSEVVREVNSRESLCDIPHSDGVSQAGKHEATKKLADVPSDPKSGKPAACGIPSQSGDTADEANIDVSTSEKCTVRGEEDSRTQTQAETAHVENGQITQDGRTDKDTTQTDMSCTVVNKTPITIQVTKLCLRYAVIGTLNVATSEVQMGQKSMLVLVRIPNLETVALTGHHIGMILCMYVCMYVCMYTCVCV